VQQEFGAVSFYEGIPSFGYAGGSCVVVFPGKLDGVAYELTALVKLSVCAVGIIGPYKLQFHG
jgi:hypothetical protein